MFPVLVVILSPIVIGIGLGVPMLAGLLLGAIVSGFMLGGMMSAAGGAWDNGKKFIEDKTNAPRLLGCKKIVKAGEKPAECRPNCSACTGSQEDREAAYRSVGKRSVIHKAAVVGDTIGDPFKDTSGPALNILIKLMSYISVVLTPVFKNQANYWYYYQLLTNN
jgi:K(+)-stimulated pyrophosphate-energized sodium pump